MRYLSLSASVLFLFAQAAGVAGAAQAPQREMRTGDKSLEIVVRTDERYGHDGLFQDPRGWFYWNYLADPKPIQNPNLWPALQST